MIRAFLKGPPRMLRVIVLALAALIAATPVFAQDEWRAPHVAGAKPHRVMKFYPESSVGEYQVVDFDAVEMVVGIDRKKAEPIMLNVEGKITKYHANHKPGTSALAML